MIYDENYKAQILWDSENRPTLPELLMRIKQEAGSRRETTYPPSTDDSRIFGTGAAISFGVAILAGIISFVITKAIAGALTLFMMMFFVGMAVPIFMMLIRRFYVGPKKMTQEINATCIGYSMKGSDGGLLVSPVFKYIFGGREYLAYDGNYKKRSWKNLPRINSDFTIRIDPDSPTDLIWSDKDNKQIFIFCIVVAAILTPVAILMLIMVFTTPGLWAV